MELVVLTPTYNRAYRLPALYESLRRQTDKAFRWLLCDDGSTDGTKGLAMAWKGQDNGFAMDYYWKENEGKHCAVNDAMRHVTEDYVFIVDSDDYLVPDAVRHIRRWAREVDADPAFAGVSGLKGYSTEKMVGEFPRGKRHVDATNLERRRYRLRGDKAEVYRASLLKKYPFPVFEGEKFLSESAVWNRIAAEGKKLRWFPEIIYIAQYLPDGLTMAGGKELANFKGYTYSQRLNFQHKRFPEDLCELARYIKAAEKKGLTKAQVMENMQANKAQYALAKIAGRLRE